MILCAKQHDLRILSRVTDNESLITCLFALRLVADRDQEINLKWVFGLLRPFDIVSRVTSLRG